jgi:hypothetical protein
VSEFDENKIRISVKEKWGLDFKPEAMEYILGLLDEARDTRTGIVLSDDEREMFLRMVKSERKGLISNESIKYYDGIIAKLQSQLSPATKKVEKCEEDMTDEEVQAEIDGLGIDMGPSMQRINEALKKTQEKTHEENN